MEKSLVVDYYENFHKVLDGHYESKHFLLDRDLESLSLLGKRKKVLEIGCGTGRVLALCNAKEKYGVDISEFAVKKAKSKGIKAQQIDIDSQELPFKSNYFDGVLIIETLEHLFDPIHALAEANRVLKTKGILIVASPNIGYYLCRLSLLAGSFTDFHGSGLFVDEHIRFYTINSLTGLLNKTGFSVEKVVGCPKLAVNMMEKKNRGKHRSQILQKFVNALIKKRYQNFITAFKKTPDFQSGDELNADVSSSFRGNPAFQSGEDAINFRTIISFTDKRLANIIPSIFAKGLVISALKKSKPKYRKNIPINIFSKGKTYQDHFRMG